MLQLECCYPSVDTPIIVYYSVSPSVVSTGKCFNKILTVQYPKQREGTSPRFKENESQKKYRWRGVVDWF